MADAKAKAKAGAKKPTAGPWDPKSEPIACPICKSNSKGNQDIFNEIPMF